MTAVNSMNPKVKKILYLLFSLIISLPAYIILHEGGHALVAVLCGARITEFSLIGAYMSYDGGVFSPAMYSLFHCAGMLLPVMAAIIYMLAYRASGGLFCRIFSFVFLLLPFGSILSWVFVPILYMAGCAPQSDDVTKFIISSGFEPWVVATVAVLLFAGCALLTVYKRVIQNWWDAVKSDN